LRKINKNDGEEVEAKTNFKTTPKKSSVAVVYRATATDVILVSEWNWF
jgi:hypothetical protein